MIEIRVALEQRKWTVSGQPEVNRKWPLFSLKRAALSREHRKLLEFIKLFYV